MATTRALGVLRLSKSADPASTSFLLQRQIVTSYTDREGLALAGWAEDPAVSAFKIPPHKRPQIGAWLDRPEDYDCLVYWRQDRLVRRAVDFIGLVQWCREHGKALYSATENLGDVTQHAGLLIGFITAWQAERESQATSDRTKDTQAQLARDGRWRGGRPPFGFCGIPNPDGPGFILAPDPVSAEVVREAARHVIAGESVNAVTADYNRRGMLAADGRPWKADSLRSILRNRALLNGVIPIDDWGPLQRALQSRSASHRVRVSGESFTLDLAFCGECGSKIYRWLRPGTRLYYGRCRNELKRAEASAPCKLPMIPLQILENAITDDVAKRGPDRIEKQVTTETARLRLEDMGAELIALSEDYAAKLVGRAEYLGRQAALLEEQEALERPENGPEWMPAGDTVEERWARLSAAERRLWLLRLGVRWHVYLTGDDRRWRVVVTWPSPDQGSGYRERVRPSAP